MKKLLLVSDLDTNQLSLVQKALQKIETSVEEIILHYAYQIPSNTHNVIETHDQIKLQANEKLNSEAEKINNQTGIKTSIKLSLGSNNNTLKRMLQNNDTIEYVVSNNYVIESSLKRNFPNIYFLDSY